MTTPSDVRHVLLDRDGVLNREFDRPVTSIRQWEWEEGAVEGLRALAARRISVSVVTNQSAIGRGTTTAGDVAQVHAWLHHRLTALGLEVVGIFVCPHRPEDGCDCRKPRPGLLSTAIAASGIDTGRTLLIGDDQRDLEAARNAGVAGALVATVKGTAVAETLGTTCHAHLADAVLDRCGPPVAMSIAP